MRRRVVVAEAERSLVRLAQAILASELLSEQLRDHLHVDAEHRDERARARDVLHEDALTWPLNSSLHISASGTPR